MRSAALIILALTCLTGCVYDRFEHGEVEFTRLAVGYDAQIKSAKLNPGDGTFEIEGYEGVSRIDALTALLEAAR